MSCTFSGISILWSRVSVNASLSMHKRFDPFSNMTRSMGVCAKDPSWMTWTAAGMMISLIWVTENARELMVLKHECGSKRTNFNLLQNSKHMSSKTSTLAGISIPCNSENANADLPIRLSEAPCSNVTQLILDSNALSYFKALSSSLFESSFMPNAKYLTYTIPVDRLG